MKHSDKIRAKMQTALDRQKAIIKAAEDAGRDMTADETTAFEAETKVYDAAAVELKRVEDMETRDAALAASTKAAEKAARTDTTGNLARATEGGDNEGVRAEVTQRLTPLEKVGIAAWGAAKAKENPRLDPYEHIEAAGFGKISDECKATRQTLITNKTFLAGGVGNGANTIVTPLSSEFIEFLRNESAFMQGGPVPIDLSNGALDIAGGLASATGTYTAEGADIGYTEATTRKLSLAAKHLSAVTAIGNYYLDVTPLAMASILGDDLAMGLTLAMDAAGLRGDGTGANPAGILSLVNAAHKFAVATAITATPTIAQIDAEAKKMLAKIRATNISKRRRKWIMSNRVFTYLQFLKDANNNWAYPGLQLASPTWHDNTPVIVSEQVPSTLGVSTDESELYLVDFGHVWLGTARALTLKGSTEASYKNAGGTLVSAFSRDETVIRGTSSHDFEMRHDKAAVILTGVKWG